MRVMARLYTVVHVAEIERHLGEEDTKLVVTDMKGNPIRDMPATRGMFGFVYFLAQKFSTDHCRISLNQHCYTLSCVWKLLVASCFEILRPKIERRDLLSVLPDNTTLSGMG